MRALAAVPVQCRSACGEYRRSISRFPHIPLPTHLAEQDEDLVYRKKLNRAWETLRSLPMPAIASDRLVDLHNDLTHYDTTVSREIREFLRGNPVARQRW